MKSVKLFISAIVIALFLVSACKSLPEGDGFKYARGEVVYYTIDNVPMLVDKQVFKNGQKKYKVVFKNEAGILATNLVNADELKSSPTTEEPVEPETESEERNQE